MLQVLNNGAEPTELNRTFICLIPKVKRPRHTKEFRPISLCNVVMKLVTKTIANYLKTILPNLISMSQSAFVPSRLITDNALSAFEIFHYMRKKKKREDKLYGGKAGYGKSI